MSTAAQIQANRQNSLKSTGPRSVAGKAASRFNALKTGIDARTQVLPWEIAAELEALAAEYAEQFRPANAVERFLVDEMITAEWQLRRLRGIEAQIWKRELLCQDVTAAFGRDSALTRLHRRMDAAQRSYYRALKEMQRIRKSQEEEEGEETLDEKAAPLSGELGSFLTSPQEAGDGLVTVGDPAGKAERREAIINNPV
jgi:hypothetical protein